jgi:hypothetical protein
MEFKDFWLLEGGRSPPVLVTLSFFAWRYVFLRRIDLQAASNSWRIPSRRLPALAHSQRGKTQRCVPFFLIE